MISLVSLQVLYTGNRQFYHFSCLSMLIVDGNWKPWSHWTPCSLSCGGGQQTRLRICDAALHGGKNCTGASSESQPCNGHLCPGERGSMKAR